MFQLPLIFVGLLTTAIATFFCQFLFSLHLHFVIQYKLVLTLKMSEKIENGNIEQQESECVEKLRQLITDDPDSSQYHLNEEFLYWLARVKKCRAEGSFALLKSLFHYKKLYPELSENLLEAIKPILNAQSFQVLKRRNEEEPTVLLFRISRWNTNEATIENLLQAGVCYGIYLTQKSVQVQRKGIVVVIDLSGFCFSHLRQPVYSYARKLIDGLVFGAIFRTRTAFIINSPFVFHKFWEVAKFIIPQDSRHRMNIIQNDFTKIHTWVSPENLPESLGGSVSEKDAWDFDAGDKISKSEDDIKEFVDQTSPKYYN